MSQEFSTEFFGQVIKPIRSIRSQLISNCDDMNWSLEVRDLEKSTLIECKEKEDNTTISTSFSSNVEVKSSTKSIKEFKPKKSPHENINGKNILSITSANRFYCNCSEQNSKIQEYCVCGGKGEVDGKNNMVKFMEYIMEFKLGLKNSYVSSKFCRSSTLNAHENKENSELSMLIVRREIENEEDVGNRDNKYFREYEKVVLEMQEVCCLEIGLDSDEVEEKFCENSMELTIANESNKIYNSSNQSMALARTHSLTIDSSTQMQQTIQEKLSYHPTKIQFGESVCFQESYVQIEEYSKKSINVHNVPTDLFKANGKLFESEILFKNMITLEELEEKMKLERISHEGFICDHCDMEPIIGNRYHCQHEDCDDDYDLCGKCYVEISHPHPLEECRLEQGEGLKEILCKVGRMFGKLGSRRLSTGSLGGNKRQRISFEANIADLQEKKKKFGIHKSMSLGNWI